MPSHFKLAILRHVFLQYLLQAKQILVFNGMVNKTATNEKKNSHLSNFASFSFS